MAMMKYGSAAVVESTINQDQWQKSKNAWKVECDEKGCQIKTAKTIIAKYSPDKYMLSHCTIIAAVDTELANPDDPKSDYFIHPVYSKFINNNGDSWSKKTLKLCYKSFIGADNFCFPAGTRVLMADGSYKNIELIKEGDLVINRKGNIAKVSETFNRDAEELIKLESKNILSRELFVTPEHPVWVYSARKTCPKTGRPNFFNRDKEFYRLKDWTGFSVGVHKGRGEKFSSGVSPEWKNSGDLDPNRDFVTHPISSVEIVNTEINTNRAELIGWFLAEGSYMQTNHSSEEESGVVFNLGNDELDIAKRLSHLLKEEFNKYFRPDCEPRIYECQTGNYVLYLSNKKVADFFKKWCGKYSWAKVLLKEALWLPKKLQAIILKNCLNGDGCGTLTSRGYILELKSKKLIQQLLFISWRLGLSPVYKETGVLPRYEECEIVNGFEIYTDPNSGKKSRPGYMLRFSVRDSKEFNNIYGYKDEKMASKEVKRCTHIFSHEKNEYIISKLNSINKVNIPCKVYNIKVEEDNSYIVEGIIVHNCEHVQIPELSKGKVVDAVLREIPIGKDKKGDDLTTYYVDILVATEKKHKKLVADIKSGKLNTLSMGCKIKFSICSKCGNRAVDDTEACQHVKYEKNNFFYDNYGTQRKVAELCGYHDDPESVVFIDASWVANPAFTGAVMRNVVDPPSDILAKIEKANKKGNYSIDETDFLKAAFKMAQEPEEKSEPEDTKEEEPAPDESAPDEPAPDEPAPDEPAPDEPVEDQNSVTTWKKRIKERLLRELGDELVRELEEDEPVIDPDLESLDDTLIQPTASAALKQMHKMKKSWDIYLKKYSSNMDKKTFEKLKFGTYMLLTSNDLTALSDYGYNRRDFLAVMSFLDNCFKKPLSLKLKKAIAEIGGLKGLNPSEVTFTLQKLAGKKLNSNELERSIVWLKLMDSYSS